MCIIRTFLSELVLFKLEIMYIVLGRHFTSKNLAVQLTNSFRNPRSSLYSCIGNVSSFPGYLLCCRLPFVNCARQLLDRSRPARAPRTGTAGRTGLKLLNTLKFEISNSSNKLCNYIEYRCYIEDLVYYMDVNASCARSYELYHICVHSLL